MSITIDKDLRKWKEAVEKDGVVWAQFSDPSLVMSKALGIEGVPQYLIVDEKNVIVYESNSVFGVEFFFKDR